MVQCNLLHPPPLLIPCLPLTELSLFVCFRLSFLFNNPFLCLDRFPFAPCPSHLILLPMSEHLSPLHCLFFRRNASYDTFFCGLVPTCTPLTSDRPAFIILPSGGSLPLIHNVVLESSSPRPQSFPVVLCMFSAETFLQKPSMISATFE